jgi:host factor-I protein
MSAQKAQNVQDLFLNHLRKNKIQVSVYLANGARIQGIITWFDNFSLLLLRRDAHSQLVYKSTISTVMPMPPIEFLEGNRERE